MPLSTEVFVMIIFIASGPFFYFILRDLDLQGRNCFIGAYVFLTLSNTFTVLEEFWFNFFFNACEHLSITIGSIMLLVAVIKLTSINKSRNNFRISDDLKG